MLLATTIFAQPMGSQSEGERGRRGGGRRGAPPQEALQACAELSFGDSCEFTHNGRTESGTCFQPESSKPLACKPQR